MKLQNGYRTNKERNQERGFIRMHKVFDQLKGGLIVSCQALEDEPLYSSYIMQRMAYAAQEGGAVGIRANSVEDIIEIRREVKLPMIGIIKKVYETSDIYITPTMKEIDALVSTGVEIIAMDATKRLRPDGRTVQDFFAEVREKYPHQLFMADCATYEEACEADQFGFDLIGTTLRGYTSYTYDVVIPDFEVMKKLVSACSHPVIAEGGIWTPDQLREALGTGILAAVIGTAITRPREITKKFVASIKK